MKALHAATHQEIAGDLEVAETFRARTKGLLGKSSLPAGEGLLIRPCRGIHTFGMNFPIDVVFLDKCNHVVAFHKNLSPCRLTPIYLRAASVLELPAGAIEATHLTIGDEVEIA